MCLFEFSRKNMKIMTSDLRKSLERCIFSIELKSFFIITSGEHIERTITIPVVGSKSWPVSDWAATAKRWASADTAVKPTFGPTRSNTTATVSVSSKVSYATR